MTMCFGGGEEGGGHTCDTAKIDHKHHCRHSLIVPPVLSLFLFSLRSGRQSVSSNWMSFFFFFF